MISAALFHWRGEEKRKTVSAAILSLLVHLFLILFIAFFLTLHPPLPPAPPEEEAPVELTIVAPPETKKQEPTYVETLDSQRAEKPPENAPFESDKDTRAASALPASGDAPVPTQKGEESPALNFENQEYTAGREPRASAPAPAAQPQQPSPPTPQEEPQPKPRPSITQLALLEPPKPKTAPRPPAPQTAPQQPSQAPQAPGYQPQTRVTRIRGNISNRGRSAVDAAATPLGRYKKKLAESGSWPLPACPKSAESREVRRIVAITFSFSSTRGIDTSRRR